ncbi:MAG: hypothetical protein ACHQ50_12945 [Fimbriimonadales bacterium]
MLDHRYNAVNLVFIAVNNESPIQYSAVHILYPNVVIHRLCSMLNHCKNTRILHGYFAPIDVDQSSRFARFESINSDEYVRRTLALADQLSALAH